MRYFSPKFIIVIISLLLISVSTVAQDYPISLQWTEVNTAADKLATAQISIDFEGSQSFEQENSIPTFVGFFPISKQVMEVEIQLVDPIFESLPSKNTFSTSALEYIHKNIELDYYIATTRKRKNIHLSMIPIRVGRNGGLEILKSATLRVIEKKRGGNTRNNFVFAEHSKLQNGAWYKISIPKDGVYKLDYNFLNSLGINVNGLSSDQINIYGNGGELLPFDNSIPRADDLLINSILVVDGGDGQFGPNDYILFYAKGPDTWIPNFDEETFTHQKHLYTNSAYYFIGIGIDPPSRITNLPTINQSETVVVTSFNERRYHEVDNVSLNHSGRRLYGEKFDITTHYEFGGSNFQFANVDNTAPVTVRARVINVTIAPSVGEWSVVCNNQAVNFTVNGIGTGAYHDMGVAKEVSIPTFNPTSDDLSVAVDFNKDIANEEGYLDYIEVNARRKLKMAGSQMSFRDIASVNNGAIAKFIIENSDNTTIWDVTNITQAKKVLLEGDGSTKDFIVACDSLREFIAFKNSGYLVPNAMGAVANQDLHGLDQHDMVILTAPMFTNQAEELADFHRDGGLSVVVVTPQKVYNEFSSGSPDITAIKSFCKMFYDRSTNEQDMISYLLLLGDATYFNNTIDAGGGNHILSYQSLKSLQQIYSYVTDDYFGFLDDDESDTNTDKMDIGIGRFPVTTVKQVEDIIRKIKIYADVNAQQVSNTCFSDNNSVYGDWRNKTLYIADDENDVLHISAANTVANIVRDNYPNYNIYKIYIDAYQQTTTPGGERYPLVEKDIRESLERGVQLVTYFGHGGEVGWAHERILDLATINGFTNLYHLPLFLTATCEFSRFDDPNRVSAGEQLLLNPNGGAIALMSTSRPVFASDNLTLAKAFYHLVFEKDAASIEYGTSGENPLPHGLRLGDVFRVTKNGIATGDNKRNFVLLGDPALRLAYPKYVVEQDLLTNDQGLTIDTISALQRVTVTGHIEDNQGNLLENFNGYITPTVFDKPKNLQTLSNNTSSSPYTFEQQTNVLYKGNVSVQNGNFSFTFIVPKDISYQDGLGRISYYAFGNEGDAFGRNYNNESDQSFFIGGQNTDADEDTQGPTIEMFLDGEDFIDGSVTNENPVFIAQLSDDHGINTTGNSIGHDITLTIDDDTQNTINLNELYQADLDTYQSGAIRYPLQGLSEGKHSLTLKVWDIYNNSSSKTITFEVADATGLVIENVVNYPNPFTTHTQFMFQHNQNCSMLDVNIQVFSVSGKLVKTINNTITPQGRGSTENISWDGKDDFGEKLGRGVYVYKLKVKTPTGLKEEIYEKLVILN